MHIQIPRAVIERSFRNFSPRLLGKVGAFAVVAHGRLELVGVLACPLSTERLSQKGDFDSVGYGTPQARLQEIYDVVRFSIRQVDQGWRSWATGCGEEGYSRCWPATEDSCL